MRSMEMGVQGATVVEGPERSSDERSETERSGGHSTTVAGESARGPLGAPDPEVSDKPTRRRFRLEEKLSILRQADACIQSGQLGALLRREGLYSSTLYRWRRLRQQGILAALHPAPRGRKPTPPNPLAPRVSELERENQHLKRKLRRAETIIEVQKKLSEMLGIPLKSPDSDGND